MVFKLTPSPEKMTSSNPSVLKNTSGILHPNIERSKKAELWQFTLGGVSDPLLEGEKGEKSLEINRKSSEINQRSSLRGPEGDRVDSVRKRWQKDDPFKQDEKFSEGKGRNGRKEEKGGGGGGGSQLRKERRPQSPRVDVNMGKQKGKNEDLVSQLIHDLDEENEVPFFDQSLPLELVVVIFQFLKISDLINCSYVSKVWRRAANDDDLWKPISLRFGWDQRRIEAVNWKESCRFWATYFKDLRQRWLERSCRTDILEGKDAKIDFSHQVTTLSTIAQHSDVIVGGYSNGVVKLWDQETCSSGPVHSFHHSSLEELPQGISAIATDDSHIFVGTMMGNFWIWTTLGFELVFEAEFEGGGEVLDIRVVTGGRRVIVCCGNKFSIFENNGPAGWELTLEQHGTGPFSAGELITSETSNILITGSKELHSLPVQVWDINTGFMKYPLTVLLSKLVCLDGDSERMVVGVSDSPAPEVNLGLYSIETGTQISQLGNPWMNVSAVRMRETPNLVLAGSHKGTSYLYDLRKSEYPEMTFYTHTNRINMLQMDDYKLVTASDDLSCKVHDIRKGSVFWESRDIAAVRYARFSERFLVTHSVSTRVPEEILSWHSSYTLSRLTVFNFSEGVTISKVNKEYTSSYVVEPSGSVVSVSMAAPYEELE